MLDTMMRRKAELCALGALLATFVLLYRHVLAKLVADWSSNENYSHGFLIAPMAAWFAWERRDRLAAAAVRPHALGAVVVAGSLAVLMAGLLGAELFLTRISMLGVIAGSVLFVLGFEQLRILAFPILFLLLMIPIPAIVFNQIAFPLQLFASQAGAAGLSALHIPVLREGNIIVLASTTLEVAEACSGIRSLVSLLALGIVYGYFTDPRAGVRLAIALATIPIAIAANAARVAGTGAAAHFIGAAAAEGFFHTFSGWMVFVAAFAMLLAFQQILLRIVPAPPPAQAPAQPAQAA